MFSILVEYVSRQSWADAFEAVIPQRKYHDGKRKRGKGKEGAAATGGSEVGSESESEMEEDEDGDEDAGQEAAPSDWSRPDGGQQDIGLDEEEMVNT